MIQINTVHDFIRGVLKKNRGGFISPGDIDRAINSSSIDLFNRLVKQMREDPDRKVPDLLKNFKTLVTKTLTSGVAEETVADIEVVSIRVQYNGKWYPVKIVTEEEWSSRKFEDMEIDPKTGDPLNFYLKEETIAAATHSVPEDFVGIKYANVTQQSTSKKYEMIVLDPAEFESKKMSDIIPDKDNPDDPLHLNRQENTFATLSDDTIKLSGLDLPKNFVKALAVYVDDYQAVIVPEDKFFSRTKEDVYSKEEEPNDDTMYLNKKEVTFTDTQINAGADLPADFVEAKSASVVLMTGTFEGIIVPNEQFYSRQLLDIVGDRNKAEEMTHLIKKEQSYTLTVGSDQFQDLPENFIEAINIFNKDSQNDLNEGPILSDHEISDRVSSVIIPPTVEEPAARIVGNKIEFFPKPTGADTYTYILSYKEFPIKQRAVFKVENNKLYCRPGLASGESVKLVYCAHPVAKRPVVKITEDKIFMNWGIDTRPSVVKLVYLAHPATKRPIVRVKDELFEVDPYDAGYTYKVGYYKYPVEQRPIARVIGDNANSKTIFNTMPVTAAMNNLEINYLTKPTVPVYGYTESNGVITYSSGTSTQMDWDSKAFNDIVTGAFFYLGYIFKDGDIVAMNQNKEQTENLTER